MSSSATEDMRVQGGNLRPGRTTGGLPRNINITLIFESENTEQCQQITVDENQSVEVLQTLIEGRFKIPVAQQFLYGWPIAEPEDSHAKLKDLGLGDDVLLYIAVSGVLQPYQPPSEPDGEIPGTSSSNNSNDSLTFLNKKIHDSFSFEVHDKKNGERYEDVTFKAKDTIQTIKIAFAGITGIPVEYQDWSGWPNAIDNSNAQLALQDIGLDVPKHSLTLSDWRDLEKQVSESNEEDELRQAINASQMDGISDEVFGIVKIDVSVIEDEQDSGSGIPVVIPSTTTSNSNDHIQRGHSDNESDGSVVSSVISGAFPKTSGSATSGHSDSSSSRKRCGSSSEAGSPKKSRGTKEHSPTKSRKRNPCFLLLLAECEEENRKELTLPIKKIIDLLPPKSLLSLRRACKTTKQWVSTYSYSSILDEMKWSKYSLTVTGSDHQTLETVVNMNLPITRFIFEVYDGEFYRSNAIDSFIAFYFLRVRDVRLRNCFMFQIPGERTMFEALINLEKLTIDNLVLSESATLLPCPAILATLQVLKLNYEVSAAFDGALIRPKCWDFTWGMLNDCGSLLYFRLPRIDENDQNTLPSSYGIFAPLRDYMAIRKASGGIPLEYLDLKHFNNADSNYVTRFVDLLHHCHKDEVKLVNVQALVVHAVLADEITITESKYKFSESIISLINVASSFDNASLPNLEKITIDVVPSADNYTEELATPYRDLFWPKLRTIKIKDTVKDNETQRFWKMWQSIQENLYGRENSCFHRHSVEYIKIDSGLKPYFLSEGQLPTKFHNLTRLEIVSWCDSDLRLNSRLHPIWKQLKLEILVIDKCPQLNDESFTGGEDDEMAPFLNLSSSLRKLTVGLDETAVTDKSLEVFSNMPIEALILKSRSPTMITERGLLTLRNGVFGATIEYFPFHTWTSMNIDSRRFERLGKSFRSVN